MKCAVSEILPPKVRRSLQKLGGDLVVARKKRHFTMAMMAERVGVSPSTYQRVEKGDPTVALGIYAMVLFVLGFDNTFGELLDMSRDEFGLLLDVERLPKRVRPPKAVEG
jgi:DNA-binding XRE family transcriptional regulator